MKKLIKVLRSETGYLTLIVVMLILALVCTRKACAGGQIRTVFLSEMKIETVYVRPGALTILSFPVKPDTAALGPHSPFSLKYIENDIVISGPAGAHTNMFVYLFGRRFGFELKASAGRYDDVVQVRDALSERDKERDKKHGGK